MATGFRVPYSIGSYVMPKKGINLNPVNRSLAAAAKPLAAPKPTYIMGVNDPATLATIARSKALADYYGTPEAAQPANVAVAGVIPGVTPGFEAGTPRVLFETRLKAITGRRWDVSADGKRFLLNMPVGEVKSNPITLVQNWAADVNQKPK